MLDIDLYLNKDIEDFSSSLGDRNETGMSIMYQQMTIHQIWRYIINTARAICDVSHDDCA